MSGFLGRIRTWVTSDHLLKVKVLASIQTILRKPKKRSPNRDFREEPTSRTLDSRLYFCYGGDYGTLRWVYVLDPPKGVGTDNGKTAKRRLSWREGTQAQWQSEGASGEKFTVDSKSWSMDAQ